MKLIYLLFTGVFLLGGKTLEAKNQNTFLPIASINGMATIEHQKSADDSVTFEIIPKDTIHIGPERAVKSLTDYFSDRQIKKDVYILVDEGTYYSKELSVEAENTVIEGIGQVNLYCNDFGENVMWVGGNHIVIKNIHMKHFLPGQLEGQNCTGRVIGFEGAHNITIENCDLNGCGLSALHDNANNTNILIRNNYIHNNSIGAYTSLDNDLVWLKEVDNHPVFRFENNKMENNGAYRAKEVDSIDDYIVECPENYREELRQLIQSEMDSWNGVGTPIVVKFQNADFGDYPHLVFEDANNKTYDFGFGNNDLSNFTIYENENDSWVSPSLKGSSFSIYWEWKISSFACCSGEREMVKAYIPSIVKLEPIPD